jgi:pyruvate formate lyase activating enzyme
VDELHEAADFEEIGRWIAGSRRYFLQAFTDRDSVPFAGLPAPSDESMRAYADIARRYVPDTQLRGVE